MYSWTDANTFRSYLVKDMRMKMEDYENESMVYQKISSTKIILIGVQNSKLWELLLTKLQIMRIIINY